MTESGKGTGGPRIAGTIDGDLQPCWLCGRSVGIRALFCHGCGAVQPPRDLDHFTRLGLERRFDIDPEHLARQHAGLSRALTPERFVARGVRQQSNAAAQARALDEAQTVLRDPVRRARYLLTLLEAGPVENDPGSGPEVAELRRRLDAATDAIAIDRIAHEVAHRIEGCIRELAHAFRVGLTGTAARVLGRLEELEAVAADARARRTRHAPPVPPA
ncbi:molecular chaperone DnaJ [Azospirillum halopraeferens]|uniref:molecular chaperone DnaJ n=1 Tax=Azospirillum halopraeferens TaxID=34010 RepID=UPI00042135A8|nr:molecular chaperone DnaJ [Azospirillum halopraeferens]